MLDAIAIAIFAAAYVAITLEHALRLNRAAVALIAGALLWLLIGLTPHADGIAAHVTEVGADIFGIVIFLLAAMSLVEILVHYRFFDSVRTRLATMGLGGTRLFVTIAWTTFFLSAVLDNLTTTIVMIQIARRFYRGEGLLRVGAVIVIAANAGGAFSPIGDVTTIMLWLAGKYTAAQIIANGLLPSVTLAGVAIWISSRAAIDPVPDDPRDELNTMSRSERSVVALTFASFSLPLAAGTLGLPPYLGLLLGLGIVWLWIDLMKRFRPRATHLEASLDELLRKADIASLTFFIGILLAVSALGALGILDRLALATFGPTPDETRLIAGSIILGLLSAVLDNVPLTAIAIDMLRTTDPDLWVLLALTVGTGGSILVVGSAAGVVAMGMLPELTFVRWLRIASLPALAGYFSAVAVWWLARLV